ncbi:MAG: pyridoxal-phosphate dependent enzyme [Candidatus Eisenbacteria sp.]|nr:pyridoxal-phosphate dependent enzyme [Candidatus Eisenbacteria bacterium]
MEGYRLICTDCARVYDPAQVDYTCPECFAAWTPGKCLCGVLRVEFDDPGDFPGLKSGSHSEPRPPDQRRYAGLLPLADVSLLPDLPVGPTPLLGPARLRAQIRMPRLYLKDDTRLPTGSLKDRASSLVVAKAREKEHRTIATASTGNAATALAGMCAASGLEAVILVPAAAPTVKLVQMLQYGAQVVRIDGTYDDAFGLCLQAGDDLGWYNRSTAYNPYTIEGKKTVAFEIWEQLGGEVPDAVVVPVGDGVILAGVEKGFADLERFGLIARQPRLIAVQAAGSAAVVAAYRESEKAGRTEGATRARVEGATRAAAETASHAGAGTGDRVPHEDRGTVRPLERAETIADSIRVAAPANGRWALAALQRTRGAGVTVSDEEILDAVGLLARESGVFAEPAGAAALAGALAAVHQGLLDPASSIVLLVTGSGLKDPEAAARGVALPPVVPVTLDALLAPVSGTKAVK